MKKLHLSRDLALPIDVAGEAIAVLAKRGAGKTNTATVLVEELYAADVQTVILDPVGAWWGLRSSADGQGEGLKIARLGGQHGDVPLEQTAGALIADVAVDSGQSLVVDLSDFPSKASVQRFVTDFAERLYRRKAREQSLLHLVLEEADEFAPQGQRNDTARMRGAIEQIVRRGRSRGLGVTLITQRSAVLNKDVLTQADVLIVMRTTGPHDVAAIKEWVNAKGDEHGREVIESLPSMQTGEAWIWNPERDLLKRTKVRARKTFDSSQTPKAGQRRTEPRKVAEIDPAVLGKQIAETAEQAKANDPRALRKEIIRLEQLVKKQDQGRDKARVETVVETVIEKVEVPILTKIESERLADGVASLRAIADQIESAVAAATRLSAQTPPASPAPVRRQSARPVEKRSGHQPRTDGPAPTKPPPHAPARESVDGDMRISGPQQKILDALAWFEAIGVQPRRPPLAAVAGVSSKSSGFEKNVSTLRTAGLIDYPTGGRVALTDAGRAVAEAPTYTPTDADLQESLFRMVSGPQATLLRVLIEAYDEGGLSRDELADRAGVSALSSGFEKNVSTLKSFELVEYPERGLVAAAPIVFVEGVPV